MRMVRCVVKLAATVAPVTLTETVKFPTPESRGRRQSLDASRRSSVQRRSSSMPSRTLRCDLCVQHASLHARKRMRTPDAQQNGHDVASFEFRFLGNSTSGEKTVPHLCVVDHVSDAVFAVLTR